MIVMKKVGKVIGKGMKFCLIALSYLLGITIIIALFLGNIYSNRYAGLVSNFMGHSGSKVESSGQNTDTVYFKTDFDSEEEWRSASDALVREVEQEGIVLLRNEENSLPLISGSKISLLGQNSVDFVYGGVGSGSIDASELPSLKDSMLEAGFEINEELWNFYTEGEGKNYRKKLPDLTGKGEFQINEVPVELYTDEVIASFEEYSDVAIIVIGRSGGESADLTMEPLSTGRHYLELDEEEEETLKLAKEKFDKVVVLLNTSNPMELGFLETYDVDAAIWVGAVGQSGILAIGDVLNGQVNPSGRLVDTYAYDVYSAPAMANIGNYTISTSQVQNGNKYLHYGEGIYVGYRYYETRYEDTILGTESKDSYNYNEVVQYPFGYGLSYTDFAYSNYQMEDKGSHFEIQVTVTNIGEMAGREVVQVYMQSPYTDYDKENQIEKSAVQLVGFDKTKELAIGESETVLLSIPKEELRVYDRKGYQTYIVDAGTYYFTTAKDAHTAVNNILSAKGKTISDGMTKEGSKELVSSYQVSNLDSVTYAVSSKTGKVISNQFVDADLATYEEDVIYLSRSDWTGTWPSTFASGDWQASSDFVSQLEIQEIEETESQMPITDTIDEKIGHLDIIQLKGLDYDDPMWDILLNQLTVDEMDSLVRIGGYATVALPSINLPATVVKDGPAGISNTLVGGQGGTAFPTQVLMGSTWNAELLEEVGRAVGNDGLQVGVNGWYAPGVNIHRIPFGGRNFEYFSEDPYLSATLNMREVEGVQSKGMFVHMKHYALNDTETNRIGVSVFANEQSIREIYLRPFEDAVRHVDASGVMTAMNRIGSQWAGAHYGLMTGTLRDEWGFTGIAVTDQASFSNFAYADFRQGLVAGTNLWLNTDSNLWKLSDEEYTPTVVSRLRESSHSILYTIVNSNAMNGIGEGDKVILVTPQWKYWLWLVTIILGILAAIMIIWPSVRIAKKFKRRQFAKKGAK